MNQAEKDKRIHELQDELWGMKPKIESIIDELKRIGQHSSEGNNSLVDVRSQLEQLSKR